MASLVGSEKLLPVSHSYDKNRLARIKINTVVSPVVDEDEEVGALHTEISGAGEKHILVTDGDSCWQKERGALRY